MQMVRIIESPSNHPAYQRITQIGLVIETHQNKCLKLVLFDDGKTLEVPTLYLQPYKRQLPNDNRELLKREQKDYSRRINRLVYQMDKMETSPKYTALIRTNDPSLEAINNDLALKEKEVQRLWKEYHFNGFWIKDIDSEEKLMEAETVYTKKRDRDFWQSDFKTLPIGEVQTLF